MCSSGFYWVFTRFYKVLLGFIGFYWVLLGLRWFYWVLLGITGFYWVLLGLNTFLPGRSGFELGFTEFY